MSKYYKFHNYTTSNVRLISAIASCVIMNLFRIIYCQLDEHFHGRNITIEIPVLLLEVKVFSDTLPCPCMMLYTITISLETGIIIIYTCFFSCL